jgi:Flp pilus assembly protein TadD
MDVGGRVVEVGAVAAADAAEGDAEAAGSDAPREAQPEGRAVDAGATETAAGGPPDPTSANDLVAAGNRALGRRDFARAVNLFQRALAIEPGNRGARMGLGRAAFQQGDFAEAVRRFEPLYRGRGNIDLGVAYVRVGRVEDAERQFELILEHDPDHTAARRALDALNR